MTRFRKPSSAPLWQDEFPVFTAAERYVSRRQFTKFLTLTSFGMLAGNLWILGRSLFRRSPAYPRQPVAAADELAVGGVKMFTYPTAQDPCILVRTGNHSYVAYSQKCTHLSCAVYYAKEQSLAGVPLPPGSLFHRRRRGSVGPPRRALPRVALEMKGGQLVAVRMEGGGA